MLICTVSGIIRLKYCLNFVHCFGHVHSYMVHKHSYMVQYATRNPFATTNLSLNKYLTFVRGAGGYVHICNVQCAITSVVDDRERKTL